MAVKIVTDSVADIPPDVVRELGITIIPVLLRFGEKVYRDGVDISSDEFYEMLARSSDPPSTSVPAPSVFAEAFDRLAGETDEILCIILSSKLSGMYTAARQGADLMKKKCRLEFIDSQQAVMAEGFLAIKSAQAAREGANLDEVVSITRKNMPRVNMRAAFDTLEYLRRGGRIGRAQSILGSMLRVNPLITLKDGLVEPAGRARTRAKAIDLLFDFAAGYSYIEELAVEEAACPDDSDLLVERLGAIFPADRIYRSRTTPVIGTHTGPGLLLVSVLGDK